MDSAFDLIDVSHTVKDGMVTYEFQLKEKKD